MDDWQDAYGHEMLDYCEGRGAPEIVERDDGHIAVSAGPAAYFAPYEEWAPHQQEAIAYARGRILDIGCGAGRHAIYLQDRGHQVLGIDVSPLALEVARRRGLRQTRLMSITELSSRLGIFDTIVMFGNNCGLFGSYKRARWLLRRFRRMTPADGRLIVESLDPYDTENPDHLAYHERNRQSGRMGGQVRIRVRYGRRASPWFDYLLVSTEEMRQILEGTGWTVAHLFGGQGGPSYAAVIEKTAGPG